MVGVGRRLCLVVSTKVVLYIKININSVRVVFGAWVSCGWRVKRGGQAGW